MLVSPPKLFGGGRAGPPCLPLPLPTPMHADTTPCCSYLSTATFSGDAAVSKKIIQRHFQAMTCI